MSEKWESDSLNWIHEVRETNYKRAKGKPLRGLLPGPGREAQALRRRLRLKRLPLRPEERSAPKGRFGSR